MTKQAFTILLCEDDSMIGPMYEDQLHSEGYRVIRVVSGDKIIPAIRTHVPDVVLLDMILPKKMGFEILQELKNEENKRYQHIPVIMLSNLHQDDVIASAKRLGAVEYLVKSDITPKEIGIKVKQYLPHRESGESRK